MTRTRVTNGRLEALVARLDERDLAVTATLKTVRMATGDQLRRIHFHDVPGAERVTRRVLARLVDLSVLTRLERSIGGKHAGSAGYVYSLGIAGQGLAKGSSPAGGHRLRKPWTPSLQFVRHVLAGAELLAQLSEAEQAGRLEVIEFAGEPGAWRRFLGRSGVVETLKPDAFVRIGLGEFEDAYFIEVDLATESPTALERKLDRYRRYYATGMEQHRTGVFPKVVWVVPNEHRQAVVVDACSRQPAESWPLFRVVTYDRAVDVMAAGAEP